MSTPSSGENCTPQGQGGEPVAGLNTKLALCSVNPTEKHHATIATPESQLSESPVPRADAAFTQQRPLPRFDIAHQGWEASNVSTAKCDLCHKQRCGTLQKCHICKLSICQECCVAGRLQNDRRHTIDATAVDWDVPPSSRKRKNRSLESNDEPPTVVKKQRAGANTGRGSGRLVDEESTGTLISSTVDNSPPTRDNPATGSEIREQISISIQGYSHTGPMEPRLSVAPESHYASTSRGQHTEVSKYSAQDERGTVSPDHRGLRLPFIESCDGKSRNWDAPLNETCPTTSSSRLLYRHPVSPTNGFPQGIMPRPVLPPISFLDSKKHWQHHQPAERLQTSSNIFSRLEHFLHHHQQPATSEMWPQHEHVNSLGIKLADAARMNQMSSPASMPLDGCLRNEIQNEWNSPEFTGIDPDAGRRYRYLLAAAYFASTCLGLSPQLNAAREWLREKEHHLCEMGYEPTKSIPLMNFLQEIGAWYLRQAQR
ncbi:hypothetical protein ACHAQJ_007056 [Trichoderma viride]